MLSREVVYNMVLININPMFYNNSYMTNKATKKITTKNIE